MKREFFALGVILIAAACLRFYGLAWDGGYLFHPDERKILLVAAELRLPTTLGEFFLPASPLNPKFFAYGSFPIYLLKMLSALVPISGAGYAVPWREDFVGLMFLGRVLSALFDLGTILFTFLLARRLYSATIGLFAAACVAVTVLHIQLAHFYAVDTLLTLLVVATVYYAARYAQGRRRRDAVLLGIVFGLALATKITAAPLIAPILVAVVRARNERTTGISASPTLAWLARARLILGDWCDQIWRARKTLAKIFGVAFAVFVITQPYAWIDPLRFWAQVATELLVARGWLDYPYTRQYANTLPFVYPILQSSVWGMSLPLGIFAWGGSAWFAWRGWRERDWRAGLLVAWAGLYFFSIGAQHAKYLRYLLPLTPFLFIMASAGLAACVSRFAAFVSRVAVGAALGGALVYSLAFVSLYAREHPWIEISRWVYANVPMQATLATEYWDDQLPLPMQLNGVMRAPSDFRYVTLPLYDDDDAQKIDALVEALSATDYIVLATQRLSATIERLPARYPISARYYRLLFAGELGFDLAAFAQNGIALDGVVIADDRFNGKQYVGLPPRSDAWAWNWGYADESFTVYDHPLPLVFRKTRALSPAELRALLTLP